MARKRTLQTIKKTTEKESCDGLPQTCTGDAEQTEKKDELCKKILLFPINVIFNKGFSLMNSRALWVDLVKPCFQWFMSQIFRLIVFSSTIKLDFLS